MVGGLATADDHRHLQRLRHRRLPVRRHRHRPRLMAARRSLALFGAGLLLVTGLAAAVPTAAGAVTTSRHPAPLGAEHAVRGVGRRRPADPGPGAASARPCTWGAASPRSARSPAPACRRWRGPTCTRSTRVTGAYRPGVRAQRERRGRGARDRPSDEHPVRRRPLHPGERSGRARPAPSSTPRPASCSPIQRAVRNGGARGQVLGLKRVGRQLYVGGNFGVDRQVSTGATWPGSTSMPGSPSAPSRSTSPAWCGPWTSIRPTRVGSTSAASSPAPGPPPTASTSRAPNGWPRSHTADTGVPPGRLDTAFVPNVPVRRPVHEPDSRVARGAGPQRRWSTSATAVAAGASSSTARPTPGSRRTYSTDGDVQTARADRRPARSSAVTS